MKKIVFIAIGLLLFTIPLMAQTENIIVVAYESGQPFYAPTSKQLQGGSVKLFSAGNSYWFNGQVGIGLKNLLAGTEKFQKNRLALQAEFNCWGPLVISVSHRSIAEFYEMSAWSDINNPLVTESWKNEKLKFGLGFKLGDYRKSFASLTANVGSGWYANRTRLTFLNLDVNREKFRSSITGANLRLRFRPQIQIAKLKLPVWLDLENEYSYWLKSKWHSNRTNVSFGFQVFKHFGAELGVEIVKQAEDRHLKMLGHYFGLAILF